MRIDYEPESQKRPFLNQEEGSAKLLSLREPVTRILAPFLKRWCQFLPSTKLLPLDVESRFGGVIG
jgi:hypothetical protein